MNDCFECSSTANNSVVIQLQSVQVLFSYNSVSAVNSADPRLLGALRKTVSGGGVRVDENG